jgi:hypothetical protein
VVGLTVLLPSWLVVWVRNNYLNPAHTRAPRWPNRAVECGRAPVRAGCCVGQPPPQCVSEGYRAIHRCWIEAGPDPTCDEVMSSAQR